MNEQNNPAAEALAKELKACEAYNELLILRLKKAEAEPGEAWLTRFNALALNLFHAPADDQAARLKKLRLLMAHGRARAGRVAPVNQDWCEGCNPDNCGTGCGRAVIEGREAQNYADDAYNAGYNDAKAQPADPTARFMADVAAELERARAKFPGDRIMTIALAEEFGELAKAMLDESGANVWKEAVQTAAMAARVAIDGDSSVDEWRAAKGLDNHRCAGAQ